MTTFKAKKNISVSGQFLPGILNMTAKLLLMCDGYLQLSNLERSDLAWHIRSLDVSNLEKELIIDNVDGR